MPGASVPETCPICAGWLHKPPLERCTEPERHAQPPGKGFDPPYVAEAVQAVEPDDDEEDEEEQERNPPWTS